MFRNQYPVAAVATAGAFTLALQPISAFDIDSIQPWMSYHVGEFRFRPEFSISTTFTDNLYYAGLTPFDYIRPSAVEVFRSTNGAPYFLFPGTATNQYDGRFGPVRTNLSVITPNGPAVFPYGLPYYPFSTVNQPFAPRKSEVISTFTPGFKLQYGDEVLNYLALTYGLAFSKYLNTGIDPSPQQNMGLLGKFEYSRLKLEVNSSANFVSSFLSGGANQGGSINGQSGTLIDRWVESSTARVTYDLGARTDVFVEAKHALTDYSSTAALYGTAEWTGTLGANYHLRDEWLIFSEAHYGQTTTQPSSPVLTASPHSEFFGGDVGIKGNFTSRLSGTLKVGYEQREYPAVSGSTVGAPSVGIDISYAARAKTQLTLSYLRATSASPQVARQSYVYDNISFTIAQNIGETGNWSASFSARYTHNDFASAVGLGQAIDQLPYSGYDGLRVLVTRDVDYSRTDNQFGATLALNYTPRPWLRASLAYQYDNFMTDLKDPGLRGWFLPSYDNHQIILSINLGY